MPTRTRRALQAAIGLVALKMVLRRCRAIDFADRTVLITGGSRGLGLELARQFANRGARLILLARDAGELARASGELANAKGIMTLACDLRDPKAIGASLERIRAQNDAIDVLVNNAGVIQVGPLENLQRSDFEEALAVHFWAPLELITQALPLMNRPGARIVNIASVGGHVAVPHLLPYCASKFALVGLSDGLRAELARRAIRVTTVIPGLMRTGSHVNAWFKGDYEKEFALFSTANALPLFSMNAERAAHRIVEACRYGDAALTLTTQARAMELANILLPNFTAELIKLTARVLPRPVAGDERARTGRESRSSLAPRWLTRLADRATKRNNEARTYSVKSSQARRGL